MEHRKILLTPVIIGISLLLINACANKMAVVETPSTDASATEAAVSEAATATSEPAPAEPTQDIKDSNQPEIIPLAAPATQTTETGATTAPTVDNGTQQTQQAAEKPDDAAQAAQEVMTPPDIASITKKFINHRSTLWLSRTSAYRLYAGGLFTTEYAPDKGTITIKSGSGDPALECKYTMDGKLDPKQKSQLKACGSLMKAFENYLSN